MIQNIDALCTHILQNHFYFLHNSKTQCLSVICFSFGDFFFCILSASKNLKVLRFFGGKLIMIMNFSFLFLFGFVYRLHLKFEKAEYFLKTDYDVDSWMK